MHISIPTILHVFPRSHQQGAERVQEAGTQPNIISSIPRFSGAEARALMNEPVMPTTPVILTDAMQGVPAMWKWTPDFFRSLYPKVTKKVRGRNITLAEQLELIRTSTDQHPAPYPFNLDLGKEMPELLDDLRPFLKFGNTDLTTHPRMPRYLLKGTIVHELFFGGKGASYPWLHYDILGMHTQITQIMGDKEFILFDPSQTPFLYPHDNNPRLSRVNNVFDPDLKEFPLFAKARSVSVTVHEGETLFFPNGWWHVTRMSGPSITYGRAVLNASNWDRMMRENFTNWCERRPALAIPTYLFSKLIGAALYAGRN